jgi:hypothetical protein
MTQSDDISADLEPGIDPHEAEALARVANRLTDERPVPRPAFRGALWRHLSTGAESSPVRRPQRVGSLIAAFAGSGFLLLAIAAMGLAGAGPFAT